MGKAKISHKTKQKRFVVTEDLEPLLRAWYENLNIMEGRGREEGWRAPDADFFARLRTQLQRSLEDLAFPAPIPDEESGETIHIRLDYRTHKSFSRLTKVEGDRAFWIALDDVYVRGANFYFPLTRVFGVDRDKLGLAIRPERPPAPADLHSLAANCKVERAALLARNECNEEVVIADDGAYTGGTLLRAVRELRAVGVIATEIRLGITTRRGRAEIETEIESHGDQTTYDFGKGYPSTLHDWITERDFYLGVPRSGHTYGMKTGDHVEAARRPIGHPYVDGWGDIAAGAKIRTGRYQLSARLTDYSIRLWQEVQRVNSEWLRHVNGGEGVLSVSHLPRFPGPGYDRETFERVDEAGVEIGAVEYLESIERVLFNSAKRKEMRESNDPWDY